jgi:hypothetical protein
MRWFRYILLAVLPAATLCHADAQVRKSEKTKLAITRPDSVVVSKSQVGLFLPPKRNLLVTHVDLVIGASKVKKEDQNSELGFSGTVKGLYALTGALYVNMGVGVTRMNSRNKSDAMVMSEKHSATAITLPLGIGFSIGDDRAQIVNGIDFFPVYYVDVPGVKRPRQFAYGVGVDLGFHIRIRERLHLGMIGKLQMFEPFDRDEHQSFPRYGFVGGGVLLRYD